MKIIIERNLEALSVKAALLFTRISEDAIRMSGRFVTALSGGKTPRRTYEILSTDEYRKKIDWSKIHIFFVDERCVPPDHPESNFGLIRNSLLERISIPPENVYPIRVQGMSISDSVRNYEDRIKNFFYMGKTGVFPSFDFILLGIGQDGHTASLFPGTRNLSETEHLVVAVERKNAHPARITLTLPVLNNAANVVFLVSGSEKASVLEKVVRRREPALPASLINPARGTCFFLIDEEAGKHILAAEVINRA